MVVKIGEKIPPDRSVRVGFYPQKLDEIVSVLVAATTGVGKTSALRPMVLDTHNLGCRNVILDTGDEWADFLRDKGDPRFPVHEISAFEEEGDTFDLPPMVGSELDRWRFAKKAAGDVGEARRDSDQFFVKATASIVHDALAILHHHSKTGRYTLADVVRLATNKKLLTETGRMTPGVGDPYLDMGDEKTAQNVAVSVRVALADLAVVAALSLHAKCSADLTKLKGSIVIRWADRYEIALRGLVSFLFDTLMEDQLSSKFNPRTIFYLDEVRSVHPLQMLGAVCRRGRKHRASAVISIHEIAGLRQAYGAENAEEICGLMAHKVFMRCGSHQMASWAADHLGKPEVTEHVGPDRYSTTADWAVHVRERHNVIADEVRRLPLPDYEDDEIRAFLDFPTVFGYRHRSTWRDLVDFRRTPRTERPAEQQQLPPFTADDLSRLGFPLNAKILGAIK